MSDNKNNETERVAQLIVELDTAVNQMLAKNGKLPQEEFLALVRVNTRLARAQGFVVSKPGVNNTTHAQDDRIYLV